MDRRNFFKAGASIATGIAGSTWMPDFLNSKGRQDQEKSYTEYLRKSAVPEEELDIFLNENSWAQFDPKVGYILGNYMPHDGIDYSYTISTVMKDGK